MKLRKGILDDTLSTSLDAVAVEWSVCVCVGVCMGGWGGDFLELIICCGESGETNHLIKPSPER